MLFSFFLSLLFYSSSWFGYVGYAVLMLLNHTDALCLSFRGMVYDDAEALYAEVKRDGEILLDEAFDVLFPGSILLSPTIPSKSLGGSSKIIAFNTTFFPRWNIVRIPSLNKLGSGLKSLVLQTSEDGKDGFGIIHCTGGGAVGELVHSSKALHDVIKPVSGESYILADSVNQDSCYNKQYTRTDRTNLCFEMAVFS